MKVHNRKIQGSLQIIIKTARALNQILPWTIAIFTGGQLIVSLQPYLTVFLSARVVDLLSVHAKMEQGAVTRVWKSFFKLKPLN